MGEREGKELIGRGELYFLSHPGEETIFSGYGLTVEVGSKGNLVGLLMVDRPKPADPDWLKQVEEAFGEFHLVAITATGEREIVCRMQIEAESQKYLRQFSTQKADALKKALEPLLEFPPGPYFSLRWNEEKQIWQSS